MTTVLAALACLATTAPTPQSPERFEQKIEGWLPSFYLRRIPAGEITMGGKKVAVKALWVGETEITWDVYDIYAFRMDQTEEQKAHGVDAEARPSKPYGAPDRGFGHAGRAALGMTINAAEMFCKWLNKKTGKTYRIPTEAEWEYAARAGQQDNKVNLDEVAWYWDNADDKAHPVGKLKPNAWGLFDMLGNTWEWAIDLKGTPVVCGGSYNDKAEKVSFTAREYYNPKWQEADAHVPKSKWWLSDGPFIGMRVVRED